MVASLLAIGTLAENDLLPVNMKFMIEGEEEIGSPNLPGFMRKNRTMLSADAGIDFDFHQNKDGVPSIFLGVKGILYIELIAAGGEHGGPRTAEVHSSEAAWLESPVLRLLRAVNTLTNEAQEIAVPEILSRVRKPSEEDIELTKDLARRFDEAAHLKEVDATRFKGSLHRVELLKKYMFEPSVNVDGIQAGYTGPGSKTVLPNKAWAKLDIRLVPDMEPRDVARDVERHLGREGFRGVKMRILDQYPWWKTSAKQPIVQAVVKAYRYHGLDPEVWPSAGWSAPFYTYQRVLGIPHLSAGLGHGGGSHAPNEFVTVRGLRDFEKSVATILYHYAAESS